MAWRTVAITNPARLRVEASQLVIAQDEEIPLPLEDIAVLILECPEVRISSGSLARLADSGALVLVCGAEHTPVMACLPYAAHSRLTRMHRQQLATSLPFRKRCWQRVVQRKVENQAQCLRLAGRKGTERIVAMAAQVRSGDSGNIEGVAAREYFGLLFGPGFFRGGPDGANCALDYGYAVLRAAVVRALAAHGLILTQGIHHCSELNPFNLADDFLEPLRPLVDLRACGMDFPEPRLDKPQRLALVELLGCDVLVDGQRQSAINTADIMAGSYVAACREGDPALLKLPELLPLSPHRYE